MPLIDLKKLKAPGKGYRPIVKEKVTQVPAGVLVSSAFFNPDEQENYLLKSEKSGSYNKKINVSSTSKSTSQE